MKKVNEGVALKESPSNLKIWRSLDGKFTQAYVRGTISTNETKVADGGVLDGIESIISLKRLGVGLT